MAGNVSIIRSFHSNNYVTATCSLSPFLFFSAADRPELHELESLKVSSEQLRIIQEVAIKWEKLALHLKFPDRVIEIIKKDHRHSSEDACREMLRRWLAGESGQEVTWGQLIEALKDMQRSILAEAVQQLLHKP